MIHFYFYVHFESQLQSDIKFSANEKAAVLPNEDVTENTVAISSGWGTTSESSKLSNTLGSIKEKIIPSSGCSESFSRNNTNLAIDINDFCAVAADGNTQAGLCVVRLNYKYYDNAVSSVS